MNIVKIPIPLRILLFLVILLKQSDFGNCENDYTDFSKSDFANLPKCCGPNKGLIKTSTSIICSSAELRDVHYELSSRNIVIRENETFANSCQNISCVDLLYDSGKWLVVLIKNCDSTKLIPMKDVMYFPKCCPNSHLYDPLLHTCVENKSKQDVYSFGGNTQVLNVSLSHCRNSHALVDLQSEFVLNQTDKSVLIGNMTLEYQSYCIDRNANTDLDLIRACLPYDIACGVMKKRCLKKCCPDGEVYMKRKARPSCYPYYTIPFDVVNNGRFTPSENEVAIIPNLTQPKYIAKKEYEFHIDEFGNFIILQEGVWKTLHPDKAFYCREGWLNQRNEAESLTFLLLSADPTRAFRNMKLFIQGIILGVSSFFMFLTAVCYMFIPVLQNVHGRCMLMYCLFMSISSAILCCVQAQVINMTYSYCTHTGFVIYYMCLGAFAWMNVVCFDMWIAFGSVKISPINKDKKMCKTLFYYNLYGFGVPTLIVGFAYIVYKTECFPYPYIPHIGVHSCYFDKRDGTYDYIIYFLIPISVMMFLNVVLFIKTAVYCYKVKKEIQKMQISNRINNAKKKKLFDNKETLKMLMKIFLVMGIPWTFECISSAISLHETSTMLIIEAVGDYINAGQGLIIFCLLVLKQRIWRSAKSIFSAQPTKFSDSNKSFTNSTKLAERSSSAITRVTDNISGKP